MTSAQRKIVLALTIVIALTRFPAIAKSLWDWDEGLFTMAVTSYDVIDHRPHPPGYPLFIAAAKAVHLFGVPEFRSLQVVVFIGAVAIFPAAFFLAMELGFGFLTSVAGAAVLAFMPNVWVYGGTAHSDVPALALALAACALLLRGRRDARAYVAGAIVLALGVAIRPTNLLIGFAPAVIATWHRARVSLRPIVVGAILGALIAGGSYVGAALASQSVAGYEFKLREQATWVRRIDSWENKTRPPLRQLAKLFLIEPVQHADLMIPIDALAALSVVTAIARRRAAPLLTIATFAPLAIVSWLQLDLSCAGRYAISYIAVHAFLAADGLRVLSSGRRSIELALAGALVLVLGIWTWPALTVQRTTDAPPVQAMKWILRNVPPGLPVYVHGGLGPHADVYLANRPHEWFVTDEELAKAPGNAYVVQPWARPRAFNFERPHGRLWKIVRQRHFEASVLPMSNAILFASGWYPEEGSGTETFRWMAKEGRIMLPGFIGMGTATLRFHVPAEAASPTIEVTFNGQTIETINGAKGDIERSWTLLSRRWTPNELRIVTTRTTNPKRDMGIDDDRELGLSLKSVTWFPAKP